MKTSPVTWRRWCSLYSTNSYHDGQRKGTENSLVSLMAGRPYWVFLPDGHSTLTTSLSLSHHMDLGWGGSPPQYPGLLCLIITTMPFPSLGPVTQNGVTAFPRLVSLCPDYESWGEVPGGTRKASWSSQSNYPGWRERRRREGRGGRQLHQASQRLGDPLR